MNPLYASARVQVQALARYIDRVAQGPSVAASLLDLWDMPWSPRALRFAAHALQRAYIRGLDVLEAGEIEPKPINAIERSW
jgi:hypothetical protein